MCIREALRLHSPVQAVTRRYTQDVELPGGRAVPKGKRWVIGVKVQFSGSRVTVVKCWMGLPVCCLSFLFAALDLVSETKHSCAFISPASISGAYFSISVSIISLQISAQEVKELSEMFRKNEKIF